MLSVSQMIVILYVVVTVTWWHFLLSPPLKFVRSTLLNFKNLVLGSENLNQRSSGGDLRHAHTPVARPDQMLGTCRAAVNRHTTSIPVQDNRRPTHEFLNMTVKRRRLREASSDSRSSFLESFPFDTLTCHPTTFVITKAFGSASDHTSRYC
jgi:hypothetical protein